MLAPLKTYPKSPAAVLDYGLDWIDWLGEDTILTSSWTVPAGLTKASELKTSTTAIVWLTGGTDGVRYTCTNLVTTVGGRSDDRSIQINVAQR